MEIKVPTSMYEVPLYQMVEYSQLPEDMPDGLRQLNAISIFCNITMEDVRKMPLSVLNKTIVILSKWVNEKPKFIQTFEFNGIKYGFNPNINTIAIGEYIDIENYCKEPKDMYKVMSVLYRPITIEGQKNKYDIETYKGEVNDSFKEMPSEVAFGSMLFFWTLGIDLLNCIRKYLRAEAKAQRTKSSSQKNGDGWQQYNYLLLETLQNLKRLVECPYTPLSNGVLTKATLGNLNKQNLEKQQNDK
jgi:hypothetical protein